tara:strand:- start:1153 stop:1317 length:165 start_codon:yes stop_codon:yes gene_type:complete
MKKTKAKKNLKLSKKSYVREQMIEHGAYDGRFKEKTFVSKKHKKVKYKHKLTQD